MARLGPWDPNLYTDNPWHARPFMRGETDDLPFDRDSIVLYSSYTEAIFWKESETPDNITNAKSVLESKILNPTNTDYGDEAVASQKDVTENAKAIWLGIFPTAKLHALWKQEEDDLKDIDHGAVLEIHLPTEPMQCLIDSPPGSGESGILVRNSKDFINKIGSGSRKKAVQELRRRLKKVAKVDSNFAERNFEQAELVQFATPYRAHLDNVTQVWTPTFTKGHVFMSIDKYLENIRSQESESPTFSIERELKEEYREHEKLRNTAEKLRRSVIASNLNDNRSTMGEDSMLTKAKKLRLNKQEASNLSKAKLDEIEKKLSDPSNYSDYKDWSRRLSQHDDFLKKEIKPYVEAQYQIKEILEEMAEDFSFFQALINDHKYSFGRKIRTCHELVKYSKEIETSSKAFYNSVLKIDEREKEKLRAEDWKNGEEAKEFEMKANQGLLNIISNLPDLRPLESNLEKNPKEWLIIEARSVRGELS